jgi:hypothetical protein
MRDQGFVVRLGVVVVLAVEAVFPVFVVPEQAGRRFRWLWGRCRP